MPDLYICPTSGETESRSLGGFDICCDHPRCPGNTTSHHPRNDETTEEQV